MALHRLHRVNLAHGQRHKANADEDRQRDDRPGPRQAERAVEPIEHVAKQVLDRRERAEEQEEHHAKSFWSLAKSTPPWLHGLQRSRRQPARIEPLTKPYSRSASSAYCEQDGWYLQRFPVSGLTSQR